MDDWTVHLEFEEGISRKFWRARVEGRTLYINYGRTGSAGQTQVKDFGTPELAGKEYDKLIRDKRKKGYIDVGAAGRVGGDIDEDEVNDDREDDDEDDEDVTAVAKRVGPTPAARRSSRIRLLLETDNRKVESWLCLDGDTVRLDSTETYPSAEAANQAHERLKQLLLREGYKES